jgi:uncharacterized membrane protein
MYITTTDIGGLIFGRGCRALSVSLLEKPIGHTSPIPLFFILCHGMTLASRFLLMLLLYWGALTLPIFLFNVPSSIIPQGHFLLLCVHPE